LAKISIERPSSKSLLLCSPLCAFAELTEAKSAARAKTKYIAPLLILIFLFITTVLDIRLQLQRHTCHTTAKTSKLNATIDLAHLDMILEHERETVHDTLGTIRKLCVALLNDSKAEESHSIIYTHSILNNVALLYAATHEAKLGVKGRQEDKDNDHIEAIAGIEVREQLLPNSGIGRLNKAHKVGQAYVQNAEQDQIFQ
jgi:hypothetical protein